MECIAINGCRCKRYTFDQLKAIAKRLDEDLTLLQLETGAGTDCGRCAPWLARVLSEGQSVFYLPCTPENTDLQKHFGTVPCPSIF